MDNNNSFSINRVNEIINNNDRITILKNEIKKIKDHLWAEKKHYRTLALALFFFQLLFNFFILITSFFIIGKISFAVIIICMASLSITSFLIIYSYILTKNGIKEIKYILSTLKNELEQEKKKNKILKKEYSQEIKYTKNNEKDLTISQEKINSLKKISEEISYLKIQSYLNNNLDKCIAGYIRGDLDLYLPTNLDIYEREMLKNEIVNFLNKDNKICILDNYRWRN